MLLVTSVTILCGSTGEASLGQLLLQQLCDSFAGPILFWPLAAARSSEASDAGSDPGPDRDSTRQRGGTIVFLKTDSILATAKIKGC